MIPCDALWEYLQRHSRPGWPERVRVCLRPGCTGDPASPYRVLHVNWPKCLACGGPVSRPLTPAKLQEKYQKHPKTLVRYL